MADETRLAGSLIGAVLESTGYHWQQQVLEAFQEPFANEIGGLIYLVAIIMAILYTATQGGFRMGAWLLIGPPLFFATVQVTSPINNARWEFGEQARPQHEKDNALNKATGITEQQATVSTVFAKYVYMVSATVREIVDEISSGRENTDRMFFIKAQLFAMMHTAEIKDAGLLELFHRSISLDCGDIVRKAELVNDPLFRAFDDGDVANPQIAALQRSIKEANDWFLPSKTKAETDFKNAYYSRQINLGNAGLEYVRRTYASTGVNEEVTKDTVFSCADIWLFVLDGIKKEAEAQHNAITKTAEKYEIPPALIDSLLLQANAVQRDGKIVFSAKNDEQITPISANDVNLIKRIISLFLFRNEHANPDKAAFVSWMSGRHENRVLKTTLEGDNSITERSRVSVREWAEKERLVHTAASLPYYQGLILLFLGALFPFFALLLLIPGKHTGFLMWFSLWFWAKSWDIGFAVVMLLDDLLFAMFVVEKQEFGETYQMHEGADQIGLAFAALRELDPSFQLSTYYNLVSIAMMAVPIASAQLFLGTMAQGAGLIEKGARAFADAFADSAHHHMTRDAMHAMRQEGSLAMQRAAYTNMRKFRAETALARARHDAQERGIDVDSSIRAALNDSNPGADRPLTYFTKQNTAPNQQAGTAGSVAAREQSERGGRLAGLRTPSPIGGNGSFFQKLLTSYSYFQGSATANADAQSMLAVIKAEMTYEAARAEWFTVHAEIKELHVRAAPLGILPLPPSGGDFTKQDVFMQEYARTIENYKRQVDLDTALIKTYQVMSEDLLKMIQNVAGPRIKDWSSWNSLPKSERDKIVSKIDWTKTLAGTIATVNASTNHDSIPQVIKDGVDQTDVSAAAGLHMSKPEVEQMAPASGSAQEVQEQLIQQWSTNLNSHFDSMQMPQQVDMFYRRSNSPEENFMVGRNRFGFDTNVLPSERGRHTETTNGFGSRPGSPVPSPTHSLRPQGLIGTGSYGEE